MYRALVMFPASLPRADVDRLVEVGTAPVFARVEGFLSLSVSVGALMGPSAKAGDVGVVLSADFESLDAALVAIQSDDFREAKQRTEALGARIYLYEVRDVVSSTGEATSTGSSPGRAGG